MHDGKLTIITVLIQGTLYLQQQADVVGGAARQATPAQGKTGGEGALHFKVVKCLNK